LPLVLIRDFARRRKKNGKFGDEVLPVEDGSSEFATRNAGSEFAEGRSSSSTALHSETPPILLPYTPP